MKKKEKNRKEVKVTKRVEKKQPRQFFILTMTYC